MRTPLLLERRLLERRRGQALIGLLVVGLILIALYFMFLGPRRTAEGEVRPSVAKQSIDRSKEVQLTSNLQQIQSAITMFKNDNDGKPPASLEELKSSTYARGFPAEMWVNPVDGKPLVYDATTGTVAAQAMQTAPGAPGAVPGPPAVPGVTVPPIPQPAAPTEPTEP